MKKLVCFLLMATLLLGGCSVVREDEVTNEYNTMELRMKEVDLQASITINPVLWFFNESLTKLQAESRVIDVPSYDRREEYVVQALISGPVSEDLAGFEPGLVLEKIEITPDLINVYLRRDNHMREEDIINAKLAIAATLSDFTGKKYVNVLINEMQAAYRSMPTGVLQKMINDLSEERVTIRDKAQAENAELYAALYFLDSSETYLLPEVRRLVFREGNYVETIFEQLIRGPEDSYNHTPSIDSSIRLLDYEIISSEDGKNWLRLKLNKEPVVYTEGFAEGMDGKKFAAAALTYTFIDFIPNLDGVEIQIGEAEGELNVYSKSDMGDLLGSGLTIYMPNSSTSRLLVSVERIVPQGMANDPYTVLRELMEGPLAADRADAYPAMPAGITIDDVYDVYIAGSTMVLNFNGSIDAKMTDISEDNEFTMVFSIVNTLTTFEGIRSVQFLTGGQRVEYLGDGMINMIDPITKNPGIIR